MKYGSVSAPAGGAFVVTPSNTTKFRANALYVGTTGNVAVTMEDGSQVTFSTVPAGSVLPLRVSQVLATGTTASNIIGLRP